MEYRNGDEKSFLTALHLARTMYEMALPRDKDPTGPLWWIPLKARINIGTTFYEEARYRKKHGEGFEKQATSAISFYERVATEDSRESLYLANAHLGLANTYRLQGKTEKARASYEQCIEAVGDSNDPRARCVQELCQEWRDRTDG
jgi:tetratricopeptide (TPR) repeat protein